MVCRGAALVAAASSAAGYGVRSDAELSVGEFELVVARIGNSDTVQFGLVADRRCAVDMRVLVYVRNELYREFRIGIETIAAASAAPAARAAGHGDLDRLPGMDIAYTTIAHTNLAPAATYPKRIA